MAEFSIAIIGDGKMGNAIAGVAETRGIPVRAIIGAGTRITHESLAGAAVAIEFTEPSAAVANIRACVEANCPVVVGTTGWLGELPAVTEYVDARKGTMLWAANFSLGVHIFSHIAAYAGTLLKRLPEFGAHLIETHHTQKKDAPSGTAIMVRDAVQETLMREVPVTSIRVGAVPGTHSLLFDTTYEQITLTHEARDRRVFAEGAVSAARWLAETAAAGRTGVYTITDMLASMLGVGAEEER